MIRILAVEDEDVSLANLRRALATIGCTVSLDVAACRDDALSLLSVGDYDLVICDLRIPTSVGTLDADVAHGLAVHAQVRQQLPGVPAVFLTAYPENRALWEQLALGDVGTYYGQPRLPITRLIVKGDQGELVKAIAEYVSGLEQLEDIPLDSGGPIDEMLRRSVLQYAHGLGAASASVKLYGGSSGASVARADVSLPDGQTRSVVVKVQDRARAINEEQAYRQNVPNSLQVGYFAPLVDQQLLGLRSKGAVFWSIAPGLGDLFELMNDSIDAAASVVSDLVVAHEPWTSHTTRRVDNIGDLRRQRNHEDATEAVVRADAILSTIESLDVSLLHCTSHGDLHCSNVFADGVSGPTLIDFGDVGFALSAIDPVTLELSLLFNPNGPLHGLDVPGLDLDHWADAHRFALDSPYATFIEACRGWALTVSDPLTVMATGYVHAMRQLKYPDVPKHVPLAVARSAAAAMSEQLA
ncbi:MAG: response regulator [Propionicimonas sp.]